jgi:NAD(P)-dependent dehydrogenase (short-subunit alcohol dehydrogenase family)
MFVREGAKVVVADMLEHEGRQVADAIGASARFEPLDVTKEESWAAVVAATTREARRSRRTRHCGDRKAPNTERHRTSPARSRRGASLRVGHW